MSGSGYRILEPKKRDYQARQIKRQVWDRLGYVPHSPGAQAFHVSTAQYKILNAGRKWGKSFDVEKDCVGYLFIPNLMIWIVGPNYELTSKEFNYFWQDVNRLNLKCTNKKFKKKTGEMYIYLTNGTKIECHTEENPDSLIGEVVDVLIVSESAKVKRTTWEKCLEPNLLTSEGVAYFPSTPEGKNWYFELYEYGQDRVNYPDYESWKFKSADNPMLNKKWIERKRKTTTPEYFRQEYEASFEGFVGLVYKEFSTEIHYKAPFDIPKEWAHYRAIDVGYTNPTVCLWFAKSPEKGIIYIYKEYYRVKERMSTNISNIKAMSDADDVRYLKTIICRKAFEHNSEGKVVANEFRQAGIPVLRPVDNIELGINKVAELLGKNEESTRLYLFQNCPNTKKEFELYSWMESPDRTNEKETPREKFNHCMDCVRYAIMGIPGEESFPVKEDPNEDYMRETAMTVERTAEATPIETVQELHKRMSREQYWHDETR